MVQRKQRKLKSVYDPKMTSTSASVKRKQSAATKAPASSRAPSAKAPKVSRGTAPVRRGANAYLKQAPKKAGAAAPAKRAPKAVHPADKQFDNKRAKVLKDRKNGAKVKRLSGREALAERMKAHNARVDEFDKSAAQQKKLLDARKKVQESNLKQRQIAASKNLTARLKARRASLMSKKPTLKDGKVVVPKGVKATYTPVKPKLKPLPRLVKGKIVTTKPKAPVVTAGEHKAGVKAAKTKARGGKKAV